MKKILLLTLLPVAAMAAPSLKGFEKTYQNWDLICDNTGTCNMAGYPEGDGSEHSVSILFTRSAGEQAPVTAQLALLPDELGNKTAEIILNGQSLGTIQNFSSEEGNAKLSEKQTTELLTALKGNASIEVIFGEFKEKVSDKGAAAAMLKMDEFQQRLNTPSALIRQGQEKHAVLAPQAAPKIEAVSVNNHKTIELKRGEKQFDTVLALLRKSNGTNEDAENYCYELHKDDVWNKQITLYPLTKGKVLAEAICMGGYNYINYYAVLDEKLSKVEQVLANQYNYADYDKNTHVLKVEGEFKARGLGDCWHGQEAVWNGKTFIRTEEHTTGSCKGFPGGAWGGLPIFVSEMNVK